MFRMFALSSAVVCFNMKNRDETHALKIVNKRCGFVPHIVHMAPNFCP